MPEEKDQKVVLIAGGMGVAPLVFLAEELNQLQVLNSQMKLVHGQAQLIALLGAKTKKLLLCEDEFKKSGCDVKIATDDGSRGHKGFVTDLLKSHMNQLQVRCLEPASGVSLTGEAGSQLVHGQAQLPAIYACGPHPMLKQVARIAKQHNVPAQVSLEERMACGFGACLGCAVRCEPASGAEPASGIIPVIFEAGSGEAGSYKLVCKDGPVFNVSEIAWQ